MLLGILLRILNTLSICCDTERSESKIHHVGIRTKLEWTSAKIRPILPRQHYHGRWMLLSRPLLAAKAGKASFEIIDSLNLGPCCMYHYKKPQMVCTFIAMHCKYTTCIMRSLRWSSCCYWLAVDCGGWVTCRWSRLMALLLGRMLGVLLFTEACCSVKPDEAREWVDLAGSHLSIHWPAPIAGYIVIYRTCHANCTDRTVHANWSMSSW
jgi:hypothetical protein